LKPRSDRSASRLAVDAKRTISWTGLTASGMIVEPQGFPHRADIDEP